ncbi:tyrosine-protein kinase SRK3 isoform X2 [Polyodon spathula]|uniref:tyrosine-protein kinase SRK3 isoform X2 n=1 Tax=Polyodon spathula TaxID=7913 RepID=UPI001B7EE8DB|nr:tyrosine-protein kinase SRK3 isoform X2 [Polyodon spathula]
MGNVACCKEHCTGCPCSCCLYPVENDALIYCNPMSVSLYDYTARTAEDLSIQKGDRLEILKEEEDWIYVRKQVEEGKEEEGYVPRSFIRLVGSIEAEPWYFEHITKRMDAKRCLLRVENGEGAFLVWKSEEQRHYYLSERKQFISVSQLVKYYTQHEDGLCTQLDKPCVKLDLPSIHTLSHFTADQWEVERSTLKKVKWLDSGEFGNVWEGIWNNTTDVAIKEVNVSSQFKEQILNEIVIMKELNHERLLKLYAVCTQEEPFCIVTELMRNGSLSKFLKDHSEKKDLEYSLMIDFAVQIAEGMSYLERQNIIHMDLRADNILLTGMLSCKISDFGLAHFTNNQIQMEDVKVPIKWMAPEVFNRSEFTIKCDVWSFGILLTEIITYGQEPYPGMSKTDCVKFLLNGRRMSPPEGCPDSLYDIMLLCWKQNSLERPAFIELHGKLLNLIQASLVEETLGGPEE